MVSATKQPISTSSGSLKCWCSRAQKASSTFSRQVIASAYASAAFSRSVQCDYCGNQRSIKAASAGMIEDDVKDLLNFEKSTRYSDKQKAALAYAEAITWHLDTDDAFWERLHKHFSEPQLVELGCFIALTMGQQSWLRLLNIDHHQVLAGTAASMAPGYEDAASLQQKKSSPEYWAKQRRV